MNKKTIRLCYPQWQGGMNPDYVFGAQLLAYLAPKQDNAETIEIPVEQKFHEPIQTVDGIDGGKQLLKQMRKTSSILEEKQPDHIIVFGGDCSVSQVPFDYLHGKYGEGFGVLWLDAHPDITTKEKSTHLHEMVVANLMGKAMDSVITSVQYPIPANHIMYAGLITTQLRAMDHLVDEYAIKVVTPEQLNKSYNPIQDWIAEQQLTTLAVHFDLDVLSPVDFRSIYPAEPYCEGFDAAIGELTLAQVVDIITTITKDTELVGLSIAEHLPWDAIRLRAALSKISIFQP